MPRLPRLAHARATLTWLAHFSCGAAIIFAVTLTAAALTGTTAGVMLLPIASVLWQVTIPSDALGKMRARGYTSEGVLRVLSSRTIGFDVVAVVQDAFARVRGGLNAPRGGQRRERNGDDEDEDGINVRYRHEVAVSSVLPRGRRRLPPVNTWPHRPVFVRASARTTTRTTDGWATRNGPCLMSENPNARVRVVDANVPVNTETAMSFETELFVGKIVCRFKGVAASASGTKEDWFTRKRCTFQVLVQGRFKERVRCDELLTGGEFHKAFVNVPPRALVYAGQQFFKALTPSLQIDMLARVPYYYAPLGSTLTILAAHAPEDAPDATDGEINECTSRLGGPFASGVSVNERCRIMSDVEQSSALYYNTEDVYTFDYKQNVLLFDEYVLDVGFTKVPLAHHLDGQPLSFFAKQVRPGKPARYAYSYEIWHESLLAAAAERTPIGAHWDVDDFDNDDDIDHAAAA